MIQLGRTSTSNMEREPPALSTLSAFITDPRNLLSLLKGFLADRHDPVIIAVKSGPMLGDRHWHANVELDDRPHGDVDFTAYNPGQWPSNKSHHGLTYT